MYRKIQNTKGNSDQHIETTAEIQLMTRTVFLESPIFQSRFQNDVNIT